MNIHQRLYKILSTELGTKIEYLSEETSLYYDLGLTSLDAIIVVMTVEEEFNIEILDEEADSIRTFGNLVTLVQSKVQS